MSNQHDKNIWRMFFGLDSIDTESYREWLIHNRAPVAEVERKWMLSYALRVQDCKNKKYTNISAIFEI